MNYLERQSGLYASFHQTFAQLLPQPFQTTNRNSDPKRFPSEINNDSYRLEVYLYNGEEIPNKQDLSSSSASNKDHLCGPFSRSNSLIESCKRDSERDSYRQTAHLHQIDEEGDKDCQVLDDEKKAKYRYRILSIIKLKAQETHIRKKRKRRTQKLRQIFYLNSKHYKRINRAY